MSPIKGISEVIRLPRLGKIKLGIKKDKQGTTYPEPTDYFVCPEEVKKVFGEKPRKLRIMFPTNDPEHWASQYLRCYSESLRLVCRGNGKSAVAMVNNETGDTELREKQCNPSSCCAYQQGTCSKIMNLQFLLPECPGFGVYQVDTGSYHSIKNVNGSLELIYNYCRRFVMIPLSLHLVEKEVQPGGNSKTAWVLELRPTYSLIDTQRLARMPPEQALVLPSPESEAPDDLFPREVLKKNNLYQRCQEEEELIELWDRAKRQVWQLEMRDYQIAHFFMKHFHIDASLKDFDSSLPPTKFNIENLSGFLKDVESHTRFS
jgi:hypothetical protein